jgi:hypothetical protein
VQRASGARSRVPVEVFGAYGLREAIEEVFLGIDQSAVEVEDR